MQVITQFLKLETLIDDSVNQNLELQIERGGIPLTVSLMVRVVLMFKYWLLLSVYLEKKFTQVLGR